MSCHEQQRIDAPKNKKRQEVEIIKQSNFKSYEELPLFLNAKTVAEVLGVSPATSYELLHESGFPSLKIGNRIVVPKEQFIRWVQNHIAGGER